MRLPGHEPADRAARTTLPHRALAGSAAGKLLEALTLAGLVVLVPRALGAGHYGAFAVALAVATGIATATGIGGPALFARVLAPLTGDARRDAAGALVRRLARARARATVLQTTLVALPGAARTFAHDRAGAEAALRRVAALCAAVVVPACALLALLAEPLLELALGDGFRAAAEPLRIALAAAALAPLWALATQLAGVAAATAGTFAALRTRGSDAADITQVAPAAAGPP